MSHEHARKASDKSRRRSRPCDQHLCFERFTASLRWHNRDYFTIRICTHDGARIADGDRWDIAARLDSAGGGSPVERLRRALRRLLADPNRSYRVRVV